MGKQFELQVSIAGSMESMWKGNGCVRKVVMNRFGIGTDCGGRGTNKSDVRLVGMGFLN